MNYNITDSGRITAVVQGIIYTIAPTHLAYAKIKDAISKDSEKLFLTAYKSGEVALKKITRGKVTIQNNKVYYKGVEIHNAITERIIWCIKNKMPINPLCKFLENVMLNPNKEMHLHLYKWLSNKDIPITSDGCWIGYKYVQSTERKKGDPKGKKIFVDSYSKKIRQWIGKTVTHTNVDLNPNVECSTGLHVGTFEYDFSGDTRILVKVNPKDTAVVPTRDHTKIRVSKYKIIGYCKGKIEDQVVTSKGDKIVKK